MARAVYLHELQDPDFSWLITKFQELNPHYHLVDASTLPLVLIEHQPRRVVEESETSVEQDLTSKASNSPVDISVKNDSAPK